MSADNLDSLLADAVPPSNELREHLAHWVEHQRTAVLELVTASTEEAFERATLHSIAVLKLVGCLRVAVAREEGGDGQ